MVQPRLQHDRHGDRHGDRATGDAGGGSSAAGRSRSGARNVVAPQGAAIPQSEWVAAWTTVAANSFGGPAGQIAVMHDEIVVRRRWIGEQRFLHALNYCMLLPGPEAQQLATYLGWLLRGRIGGLFAGTMFILPGFVSIMALSILFAVYGEQRWVAGLFFGISAAVIAVVAHAVVRIGKRVIRNPVMFAIAVFAFVAIFFYQVPFPAIVAVAATIGLIGGRVRPDVFNLITGHEFGPVAALIATVGRDSVFVDVAGFFSTAAVLTFGGAYSVLAFISQEAVTTYGWLEPGEMISGLGMAETTPGPLIQVVQFVGFMGPYRAPGGLTALQAGVGGAVVATWVTFVPSFLWIFLGAPFIEHLRDRPALTSALSTVTAAVVGVVLNLAIWFALFSLFGEVGESRWFGALIYRPDLGSLDVAALIIAVVAGLVVFLTRIPTLRVVFVAAVVGIIHQFVLG